MLCVCAAVPLPLPAVAEVVPPRYVHQNWQTESGLPQNSVNAILQSHDGYLWLATEGGLARFDGLRFAVFDSQNTPGLRSNNIRCLLEDGEHSLWIGTADGLTRYRNSVFTPFNTGQGLPSNNVWSLLSDESHRLWAITAGGIAQFQDGRFIRPAWSDPNWSDITAVTRDRAGHIWIGAGSSLKNADSPVAAMRLPAAMEGGTIQALLVDHTGRAWIGTTKGLGVLKNGSIQAFSVEASLPSKRVTTLFESRDGAIWVGTDKGAARIGNGTAQQLGSPDAFSVGMVLSFAEDREGSIWIGSDSTGLTVLRGEKFLTYTAKEGFSEDLVRCIFQDGQGVIWAGTSGRGLQSFDGHRSSSLTTQNGLSSNVITALAEDAEGNLLIGTPDGLNILRQGRVEILTSADGLPDDLIRSIYRDNHGSLWIGTRRGLSHWSHGRFTTYTEAEGLPSDYIGAILREKTGKLWVGTLHGLATLDAGRFIQQSLLGQAAEATVTSLYEDDQGVLWIGTENNGLVRFGKGRVSRFPSDQGLPETILGILEDTNHQLWLPSPNGLYAIGKDQLNRYASGETRTLSPVAYTTTDGLRVNQFSGGGHPTAWKAQGGTLWFATAKGVLSLDREQAEPNRQAPPVVLERVMLDDRAVIPGEATELAPDVSRVAFEYAGLSFRTPQKIRFKYRLEGFDKSWVDAGTRRSAYYTNLAPGRYRFRVLARNSDGIWSTDAAQLSFRLRPHFYQTWWFACLLLLAAATLAYSFYRWRVLAVQKQFAAVLAERSRIAREIHDTLAQSFVAVSIQLELINRLLSTSVESAAKLLDETRHLVQDSLAEARQSIWDLRSNANGEADLASRLSKAVKQATANTSLQVHFTITGAYRSLPARTEAEIVRIGQEAVTNAVRHANATTLDVQLAFDADRARLTISDDGQGFAVRSNGHGPKGHYGLRGMRERAEGIDAQLAVTSAAGQGTRVLLELAMK